MGERRGEWERGGEDGIVGNGEGKDGRVGKGREDRKIGIAVRREKGGGRGGEDNG